MHDIFSPHTVQWVSKRMISPYNKSFTAFTCELQPIASYIGRNKNSASPSGEQSQTQLLTTTKTATFANS